jgi:hypothetical protein
MASKLDGWMAYMETEDLARLPNLLHDDVVFHSPIVHAPQRGKALTLQYLTAAATVLGGEGFRYTRIFDCGDRAVLEFETELEGIHVNGIDMIEFDAAGLITDFKVMIRPLKAIQIVPQLMRERLEAQGKAA